MNHTWSTSARNVLEASFREELVAHKKFLTVIGSLKLFAFRILSCLSDPKISIPTGSLNGALFRPTFYLILTEIILNSCNSLVNLMRLNKIFVRNHFSEIFVHRLYCILAIFQKTGYLIWNFTLEFFAWL